MTFKLACTSCMLRVHFKRSDAEVARLDGRGLHSVSCGAKVEQHGIYPQGGCSVLHAQQRLLEQAGLAAALVDSSNRILAGSAALRDLLGDSVTILGSPLESFVESDDLHHFQETFKFLTRGASEGDLLGEWRWIPRNGSFPLWLRLRVASKGPEEALLLFEDISDVKAMEEKIAKLSDRVAQLEGTLEKCPLGIAQCTENEELTINRALEEIVGYKREEISTFEELIRLCLREKSEEVRESQKKTKEQGFLGSVRWLLKRKDGASRFVEIFGAECGGGVVWFFQDISTRMTGEEQFRIIFDVCLEPMMITEDNIVVDCNEAFVKVIGAKNKEDFLAMRHTPESLSPKIQPDGTSSNIAINENKRLGFGEELNLEWMHQKIDGTPLPCRVLAKCIGVGEKPVWFVVWRDLTEIKKTEEELRMAKDRAEQASRAKSSFLANMSHEIRTPMNGVIGVVELLLNTPLTAEQHSYLEIIRTSGNNLLRIISDVLDLAKMESQSFGLECLEFDLREHVGEAVALLRVVAEEKGLQLSSSVDDNVPEFIVGDSLRLRQVLLNLMSNSIKFTHRGTVEVRVEVLNEDREKNNFFSGKESFLESDIPNSDKYSNLLFSIKDTGVGISEDALHRLFQAFTQADTSTCRKCGGTGLGLTISKSIVKLMGGDIHVKSVIEEGSTFSFNIRVQTRPKSGKLKQLSNAPMGIEAPQSLASLRVLVAEDNKVNQIVITRMLKNLGVQWELVENGAQAVKTCRDGNFKIILMDCHMPEMDGFDATEHIRRLESRNSDWSQPLIVALTAGALSHDKQRCEEAGMDLFLTKPVRHNDLRDVFLRELEGAFPERRMPASP